MKVWIILLSLVLIFVVGGATTLHAPTQKPLSQQQATSTPVVMQTEQSPAPASPLKATMTTLFWAGEGADSENAFISNQGSYWDDTWATHFGGVDDPNDRCGFHPCGFVPKENPFYVALPYGEFESGSGNVKPSAKTISWYNKTFNNSDIPLLKNHWVAVTYRGKTCYGQWEDVGPTLEDDFAYVFGGAQPRNTFGERAGLDVSPALWSCLGMNDNAVTSWQFVDASMVPNGPWKQVVTTRGISWTQ